MFYRKNYFFNCEIAMELSIISGFDIYLIKVDGTGKRVLLAFPSFLTVSGYYQDTLK